jgi:hypothetical protein
MKNRLALFFARLGMGVLALALPSAAQFTDTLWHDLFGGTGPKDNTAFDQHFLAHSTNWSVRYPKTDSAEIYATNTITNNTFLIYKYMMKDLEFEVTERLPTAGKNSGVQFRSTCYTTSDAPPCGSEFRVCGPQADLGNTHDGELFAECGNALVNVSTPSAPTTAPNFINNTSTACRQNRKDFPAWTTIRMRVVGSKVIGYLNDTKCYEYTITNSAWLEAGIFGLQYHTGGGTVEFKSVRLKNLATPVSVKPSPKQSLIRSEIQSLPHGLLYTIPTTGRFHIEVRNIEGEVVRFIRGMGPVSQQHLELGKQGVYSVKTESASGTSLNKIYAY